MSTNYAMDFPMTTEDRIYTQGHADYCAAHGHATHTIESIVQPYCPRCGDVSHPEAFPTREEMMSAQARREAEEAAERADSLAVVLKEVEDEVLAAPLLEGMIDPATLVGATVVQSDDPGQHLASTSYTLSVEGQDEVVIHRHITAGGLLIQRQYVTSSEDEMTSIRAFRLLDGKWRVISFL